VARLLRDRYPGAVCRHDRSWQPQHSHPHPVFNSDDRWAYFNSDRGGRANIYRAPVIEV